MNFKDDLRDAGIILSVYYSSRSSQVQQAHPITDSDTPPARALGKATAWGRTLPPFLKSTMPSFYSRFRGITQVI